MGDGVFGCYRCGAASGSVESLCPSCQGQDKLDKLRNEAILNMDPGLLRIPRFTRVKAARETLRESLADHPWGRFAGPAALLFVFVIVNVVALVFLLGDGGKASQASLLKSCMDKYPDAIHICHFYREVCNQTTSEVSMNRCKDLGNRIRISVASNVEVLVAPPYIPPTPEPPFPKSPPSVPNRNNGRDWVQMYVEPPEEPARPSGESCPPEYSANGTRIIRRGCFD